MKKLTFLLSLATLGFGLASASAAVQHAEATLTLEAFAVTAERYTEGEKAFTASLAEFRAEARAGAQPVRVELTALKGAARELRDETRNTVAAQDARQEHLAKS
jgi:hypothetical protein